MEMALEQEHEGINQQQQHQTQINNIIALTTTRTDDKTSA